MAGAFSLGNALPFVNAVAAAVGAAGAVFDIVDRVPDIDSYSGDGKRPERVVGRVRFENVGFRYPARPDVPVLTNFSLDVAPGKTVALVGSSGAGKSTIVSLLLRHYDPWEGRVAFDGVDFKDLNLEWLRSQMGTVSQEPVLFGASIIENIRLGRNDLTDEEIVTAAKTANAHEFISTLPLVGKKGFFKFSRRLNLKHRFRFSGIRHGGGRARNSVIGRPEAKDSDSSSVGERS